MNTMLLCFPVNIPIQWRKKNNKNFIFSNIFFLKNDTFPFMKNVELPVFFFYGGGGRCSVDWAGRTGESSGKVEGQQIKSSGTDHESAQGNTLDRYGMECGRPPVLVPQWCFFQSKDKGPNESVVSRWNVNEEIRGQTIRNTEEMPVCVRTSNGRTTFFFRSWFTAIYQSLFLFRSL